MAQAIRTDDLDAITAHELRERGSLKWTSFDGDTIGAFVAEMDFGTAAPIVAALHTAVERDSFGYLPPALRDEVAQACAHWQRRRYGWEVRPEQIYPVSDVLTAFELAVRHFGDACEPKRNLSGDACEPNRNPTGDAPEPNRNPTGDAPGPNRNLGSRPGSPLVLPTPAYMPFRSIPPLLDREIIEVPMIRDGEQYGLDLDGLDRAFRAGGHLLVLCNPANPTGRVLTAEELTGVTEVVERHGGRVFADEVHAPLTYPGHRHIPYASTSPAAAAHTITAVSASKAWDLPGLKCAQVIINAADAPTWQRVGLLGAPAPSVLGAAAAAAAYRSGEHWLDDVLSYLDRNRRALAELLASHLPQVGYDLPEGTYLAWLDCRPLELEGSPAEFFREHAGVAMVDGAECGEAGRGFVRLNFATPLPILQRMVTRLAHAVGDRGQVSR